MMEVSREVDDDARAEAATSQATAGPAWKYSQLGLGGVPHDGHDVIAGAWAGDGQGRDLVKTGVAGVESCRERGDEQFALENAAKIFEHQLALLIHSFATPLTR